MGTATENALDAAVLRRLLEHLDAHKDVQNIELMILAGFCRNCLSKWYVEAAKEQGVDFDLAAAHERVYGMPYSEWKTKHQPAATPEQLARFEAAQKRQETEKNRG
jgi:hypothetical protein